MSGVPRAALHPATRRSSHLAGGPRTAPRQPWRRVPSATGEVGPGKKGKRQRSGSGPGDAGGGNGTGPPPGGLQALEALEDFEEEEQAVLAPYMEAVVKVYCVHAEPNHSLPWQRKRQATSTSSGFAVVSGRDRWLLTNAHSVEYQTQVRVKKRGDDEKFLARVLSVGVDCDVALLTVDDDAFWEGVTPLTFGPLPRLQDSVAVVGYPIGGETISVTVGVVSRIEVTEYTHGSTDLLGVQIDAAINGGNSGGPVFNSRGQCVGIAFQALTGSDVENVGYVIPADVVSHFLQDYQRTGGFTGFPALGIQWQKMESSALRRACRMAPGQKGVLVRRINPTAPAAAALRPNDVLVSFDGVNVSCDGTVPFRTGERIAFSYLISRKYVGDAAALRVLRDGQMVELDVTLSKPVALVAPHLSNRDPSYFLVAGLLFTALSEPYLESEYGPEYLNEAPVKLLDRLYHGQPSEPDEQAVVLSQVLASAATVGYDELYNVQVLSFNGTPVRNLAHLASLVLGCTDEFLRFECDYSETVVVARDEALAGTAGVMKDHNIPAAMSPDLQAQLPAWPPPQVAEPAAAVAA